MLERQYLYCVPQSFMYRPFLSGFKTLFALASCTNSGTLQHFLTLVYIHTKHGISHPQIEIHKWWVMPWEIFTLTGTGLSLRVRWRKTALISPPHYTHTNMSKPVQNFENSLSKLFQHSTCNVYVPLNVLHLFLFLKTYYTHIFGS